MDAMSRDTLSRSLTPRRLSYAAIAVGAAIILVLTLRAKPVAVDLAVVTRGDMRVSVDEEGKTRIKDIYVVSAPIAGRVLRSPLEAGDVVERGRTPVAVVQPAVPPFLDERMRSELDAMERAARSAVELAAAELEQARSELAFAEQELKRAEALAPRRIISQRAQEKAAIDVDVRKAALARSEAALQMRRREAESAKARLLMPTDQQADSSTQSSCCVQVRAPANGRILRIVTKSEQVLPAGTPLVEIGDPTDLEIVVELLSTDAVKIKPGAAATVEGYGGGDPLEAVVDRIEPAGFTKISALGIEEQRVRTVLTLSGTPDKWAALGHDYRVFVRIAAWEGANVLNVPLAALFRDGDQWAVFRVERGRARLVRVEIRHRNASLAEVTAGLAAGDRVVTHPSDRVADGVRVTERSSAQH